MNDIPELKPCPFCGSTDIHQVLIGLGHEDEGYQECEGCGASGPVKMGVAAQVKAWNRRASPWQPIETAPKDGTPILAYTPEPRCINGEIYALAWCNVYNAWIEAGGEQWEDFNPTHWTPLPEPPEVEE